MYGAITKIGGVGQRRATPLLLIPIQLNPITVHQFFGSEPLNPAKGSAEASTVILSKHTLQDF